MEPLRGAFGWIRTAVLSIVMAAQQLATRLVRCSVLMSVVFLHTDIAAAQETTGACITGIEREALFHVTVNGTLRDNGSSVARSGKAVAVAPNVLATAKYVVGSSAEWQPDDSLPLQVSRVLQPVKRTIELHRVTADALQPITQAYVLSGAVPGIEAVGLVVPNLGAKKHYCLSMCPIVKNKEYTAIMTESDEPTKPNSIKELTNFKVVALGVNPKRYGGLQIFQVAGGKSFDNDGHDGSPILDNESRVVALVSAIVVEAGSTRILATPIEPLFPGTPHLLADGSRASFKCSLVDTVHSIHDQVAAHAIWSVRPQYDSRGRVTEDSTLSYESVSEQPNVAAINVTFEFYGKDNPSLPYASTNRLACPGCDKNSLEIKPSAGNRDFILAEIVQRGRTQVEPWLKDKAKGGSIEFVRLYIEAELNDGRKVKPVLREFRWQ